VADSAKGVRFASARHGRLPEGRNLLRTGDRADAGDGVISHNIIAGHTDYGIILGGPEAKVFHNVVFGNHEGGLFFFRDACRHAVVENNIFWGPGKAFGVDHDPRDNLADYNCIAPESAVASISPAYTYGPHNLRADPGFVNAAALDFTIKPDSPCADAGDPATGACYGKAPDIGLFETGHP
jgi:hypothetical protein